MSEELRLRQYYAEIYIDSMSSLSLTKIPFTLHFEIVSNYQVLLFEQVHIGIETIKLCFELRIFSYRLCATEQNLKKKYYDKKKLLKWKINHKNGKNL